MVILTIRNRNTGRVVKVKTLGIDLAKETFGLHGVDALGRVLVHKRLTRKQAPARFSGEAWGRASVGLEACGSAHYWARAISQLGHMVKLMSPSYRRGNKWSYPVSMDGVGLAVRLSVC